jgi:hypothetical protein
MPLMGFSADAIDEPFSTKFEAVETPTCDVERLICGGLHVDGND